MRAGNLNSSHLHSKIVARPTDSDQGLMVVGYIYEIEHIHRSGKDVVRVHIQPWDVVMTYQPDADVEVL
jgi:hypothetical protein